MQMLLNLIQTGEELKVVIIMQSRMILRRSFIEAEIISNLGSYEIIESYSAEE